MLLKEDNFLLINAIIFGVIGLVIFIVLLVSLVIIIKNVKPDCCSNLMSCFKQSTRQTKVQTISGNRIKSSVDEKVKKSSSVGQYLTLEDHLDTILETPIKKVEKKESHGYTLEFFPDDNTVVQIEGTSNKITKITKTKITFGDKILENKEYLIMSGELNDSKILIYSVKLNEKVYNEIKTHIMDLDRGLPILTKHPRYLRYLGTCFNPQKLEAYVISDYMAGCSLLDLQKNSMMRELLAMNEEDKVQAASDVVEAVYYIHNLSTPIVHHSITAKNIIIDGETLRAKLRSSEIQDRLEEMIWCRSHGGVKDFINRSSILQIEFAPEIFLNPSKHPDVKTDIWSLGSVTLEILLEGKLWNDENLSKKLNDEHSHNIFETLQRAMQKRMKPCLLEKLSEEANPKLRFISDCFSYIPTDRPSATSMLKYLQGFHSEVIAETRSSKQSILFPKKRLKTSIPRPQCDPLLRQQVEWNVRQEAGSKRRAFLVANRNYLGRHWPSLSTNPSNDIKDVEALLRKGGYATQNTFENVASVSNLDGILNAYVDAVNKEADDIDNIVFYFAGYGVVGEPERLKAKKALNVFTDRHGFVYDTALVMCNETLISVAMIQVLISKLSPKVKRTMLILDCRVSASAKKTSSGMTPEQLLQRTLMRTQSTYSTLSGDVLPSRSLSSTASSSVSSERSPYSPEWDLPTIPEEATEKLNSMFVLRTVVNDSQVILKAVDSHPRRMNGFLTGCLLQVLQDHTPNISDLPKFLNNQMKSEARRSKAHRGIECKAEFSKVGNVWSAPLLPQ